MLSSMAFALEWIGRGMSELVHSGRGKRQHKAGGNLSIVNKKQTMKQSLDTAGEITKQ